MNVSFSKKLKAVIDFSTRYSVEQLKRGGEMHVFKIRFFTKVFLTWLLIILPSCGQSQDDQQNNLTQKETKIDLTTNRLPQEYLGDTVNALYDELVKIDNLTKDEFETTEAFKNRRQLSITSAVDNKKIYFFRLMDYLVPFTKDDSEGYMATLILSHYYSNQKYNADNQKLILSIPISTVYSSFYSKYGVKSSLDILSYKNRNSYAGQNAYGARVEVSRTETKKYDIAIVNERNLFMFLQKYKPLEYKEGYQSREIFSIPIEIAMAPEIAKSETNLINILAVCKIKPPSKLLKLTDRDYQQISKPKFTTPYEDEENIYYIFSELLEIWIYNFKSGEIYLKLKPPFISNKQNKRIN
jgi:hypothetical protein